MARFAPCGGLCGLRLRAAALGVPSTAVNNDAGPSFPQEDLNRRRLPRSCRFSSHSSSSSLPVLRDGPASLTEATRCFPSATEKEERSYFWGATASRQQTRVESLTKGQHGYFALDSIRKRRVRAVFPSGESREGTSCMVCSPLSDWRRRPDKKLSAPQGDGSFVGQTTSTTGSSDRAGQRRKGGPAPLRGGLRREAGCLWRWGLIRQRKERKGTLAGAERPPLHKGMRYPAVSRLPPRVRLFSLTRSCSPAAACEESPPPSGFDPSSPAVSSIAWPRAVSCSAGSFPSGASPTVARGSADACLAAAVRRAVEGLRLRQENERRQTEQRVPLDPQSSTSDHAIAPQTFPGEGKEALATRQEERLQGWPGSSECPPFPVSLGETRAKLSLSSSSFSAGGREERPRGQNREQRKIGSAAASADSLNAKGLPVLRNRVLDERVFAQLVGQWWGGGKD